MHLIIAQGVVDLVSQKKVEWIAADWGTSNLRVWAMDASDQVVDQIESDKGMGALKPSEFESVLLSVVGSWLGTSTTKVVACGMVGARQGWQEAEYTPVPAKPAGETMLHIKATDSRLDVHILGGVSQTNPPDVMRGEETQIAGLLHRYPEFNGIACLPGTHTKWAQIRDSEIFHFATFMTGEMFALLSEQSVLRHSIDSEAWDWAAFLAALDDALTAPERTANRLFSLRASGLLLGTPAAEIRASLSGLLVGQELAGARPYWLGQEIAVIGSETSATIYARALEHVGLTPKLLDGTEMVLAGLCAAHEKLKGQSVA